MFLTREEEGDDFGPREKGCKVVWKGWGGSWEF